MLPKVEKEEGEDWEEWGEKEKGGRRSRRLETSLGRPEALQAPGRGGQGRPGRPRGFPGVGGSAGSWGPSCWEDMLHVMLEVGRGQLAPSPDPGLGPERSRLPPPGPSAGDAARAEHTRLPLRRRTGADSPHREAAAGGAEGPGEAHLKGLLWRAGGSPSSASGFLTPHARRTALPGEAAPRTASPRPRRLAPCLHICTRLSPPGTRQ